MAGCSQKHLNKPLLSNRDDFKDEYKTHIYNSLKLTVEIHTLQYETSPYSQQRITPYNPGISI